MIDIRMDASSRLHKIFHCDDVHQPTQITLILRPINIGVRRSINDVIRFYLINQMIDRIPIRQIALAIHFFRDKVMIVR